MIQIFGIEGLPEIGPDDDLGSMLHAGALEQGTPLVDGDIAVVTSKIVSKAEGCAVELEDVVPSEFAVSWSAAWDKDPRVVEVVLRESKRIVRQLGPVLITETHHGFHCANSGVDQSSSGAVGRVLTLPKDPDASARRLYEALSSAAGPTPVVISDTFGRPWREGLVDIALGSAGLAPIRDDRGSRDRAGRELIVTQPATADQLAAAAGLLMWKSAGVPVVVVEGFPIEGDGSVRDALLRDPSVDLFR